MENPCELKTSRNEMVLQRIIHLIRTGAFKEGDRIPSIRQLSRELSVSINTVKDAYWKLESRNYIVAVPQSGFYVKKQPADVLADHPVDPHCLDPQDISLCRIYGAFQSMGQCTPEISLAIADLVPELRPTAKMGRFITQALREQEQESFSYLMTPGHIELRQQIARLGLSNGLELSPEQIVITNGCHEAVFLALMAICRPGDTVVLESPVYYNLLQLLQHLRLKIIEIPSSQSDGMPLDALRFVLENHTVKAVDRIASGHGCGSDLPPGAASRHPDCTRSSVFHKTHLCPLHAIKRRIVESTHRKGHSDPWRIVQDRIDIRERIPGPVGANREA